jgi:hypothetical protein
VQHFAVAEPIVDPNQTGGFACVVCDVVIRAIYENALKHDIVCVTILTVTFITTHRDRK